MTNPSDHELNAALARVAGVEIAEFRPGEWYCAANPADIASGSVRWNPLHDANQIELVEEAIVKKYFHVTYRIYDTESVCRINNWAWHKAENKKRAFALAVYAMDQSQKGMT